MKSFKKDWLPKWPLYVFLVVPIAYVIIFSYIPMLGIQIAFKDFDITKGIWGSEWSGFDNFMTFFSVYNFSEILVNTLWLAIYGLIAGFPLPVLLALILNSFPNERYKKTIQTVSYMPHFISVVVMVGLLVQVLNPRTGALGSIYYAITGEFMQTDILADANAFQHLYVWSGVWQNVGWGSIIYLAALSSVDPELHEAAQIDGASRWKRVLSIDFPAILPTTVIMLILAMGGIMNIGFEKVYLMQNTLNINKSEVISTYVYKVGLQIGGGNFSLATAIGLFNSLINFTLLIIVNAFSKKVSNTSLW